MGDRGRSEDEHSGRDLGRDAERRKRERQRFPVRIVDQARDLVGRALQRRRENDVEPFKAGRARGVLDRGRRPGERRVGQGPSCHAEILSAGRRDQFGAFGAIGGQEWRDRLAGLTALKQARREVRMSLRAPGEVSK